VVGGEVPHADVAALLVHHLPLLLPVLPLRHPAEDVGLLHLPVLPRPLDELDEGVVVVRVADEHELGWDERPAERRDAVRVDRHQPPLGRLELEERLPQPADLDGLRGRLLRASEERGARSEESSNAGAGRRKRATGPS
jgi:hypothetical protein